MADYSDARLTAADERVYFKFDATNDPTAATTTVHASFKELGENSNFNLENSADTGDGQAREDLGNKHPVSTNSKGHTITFDLKQRADKDPFGHADRGFEEGKIVGLMKVKSSGHFVFAIAVITRITEGGATNGMPTWEGTAEVQGPIVRGVMTTWPPVAP